MGGLLSVTNATEAATWRHYLETVAGHRLGVLEPPPPSGRAGILRDCAAGGRPGKPLATRRKSVHTPPRRRKCPHTYVPHWSEWGGGVGGCKGRTRGVLQPAPLAPPPALLEGTPKARHGPNTGLQRRRDPRRYSPDPTALTPAGEAGTGTLGQCSRPLATSPNLRTDYARKAVGQARLERKWRFHP